MTDQPSLFDQPIAADVGTMSPVGVPIAPATGQARVCSALGAERVHGIAGEQVARLRALYAEFPAGLTDVEAAARLGIERTSVIPRRRELIKAGIVVEMGTRKNERSGVSNTVFGLA